MIKLGFAFLFAFLFVCSCYANTLADEQENSEEGQDPKQWRPDENDDGYAEDDDDGDAEEADDPDEVDDDKGSENREDSKEEGQCCFTTPFTFHAHRVTMQNQAFFYLLSLWMIEINL